MDRQSNNLIEQNLICKKFNAPFYDFDESLKLGISLNVREGIMPIHGLRHQPEGDTNGWYIWAGDFSDDTDFFKPLHTLHLYEWKAEIINYLVLPPGWRFLLAPGYEDVWFDPNLFI